MGFCVASRSRVDPYAIWAQSPAVVKTIEDQRPDVVPLSALSLSIVCKYLQICFTRPPC
jgi:hypothetical protein